MRNLVITLAFIYMVVSGGLLLVYGIPQQIVTEIYYAVQPVSSMEPRTTLHPTLVSKIDSLESIIGRKVFITSSIRATSDTSAHTHGLGVDIRAWTGRERFTIVDAACKVGFNRIGIYDRHVHLDVDDTKRYQNTIWIGTSK